MVSSPVLGHEGNVSLQVTLQSPRFSAHGLKDVVQLGNERPEQARPSDKEEQAVDLRDGTALRECHVGGSDILQMKERRLGSVSSHILFFHGCRELCHATCSGFTSLLASVLCNFGC